MGARGKLRTTPTGYSIYCPACEMYHVVNNTWQFNGDFDKPTFTPSLAVQGYNEKTKSDFVCHSFITDGEWRYLSDCTHDLVGQAVPLRDETLVDNQKYDYT